MASLIQRKFDSGIVYYIQYWEGGKQLRKRAHESKQIAKQMLRDFEDAEAQGDASVALPTETPIADVLTNYIQHIRVAYTPKTAQTEIYYLRDAFGPVCEALEVTSRKLSPKVKKRPRTTQPDRRFKEPVITAGHFEAITTAKISAVIRNRMTHRKLKPKTGNRFRDSLSSLFTWATTEGGVRMPYGRNPVRDVTKYKESAPEILYLDRDQITSQLDGLADDLQMQVMVACLIYAGLRREELLWLTRRDLDLPKDKPGTIRVRAKTVDGDFWQPKTKRNRSIPVSSQLRTYLDRWQLKHPKGTWIFPNTAGGRYDPDNFASDLRALNVAKGIGWKNEKGALIMPFGCLHFRHTFGSTLAQRGVSLYHISSMMGNSPEICRRHYAAVEPKHMVASVEFDAPATSETSVVQQVASA
ncbi:MAG TPA: site-specific integrase [Phycisphaerae bacterium]|nr:site-specific integrase [Phycisphaerae bacterium]